MINLDPGATSSPHPFALSSWQQFSLVEFSDMWVVVPQYPMWLLIGTALHRCVKSTPGLFLEVDFKVYLRIAIARLK